MNIEINKLNAIFKVLKILFLVEMFDQVALHKSIPAHHLSLWNNYYGASVH